MKKNLLLVIAIFICITSFADIQKYSRVRIFTDYIGLKTIAMSGIAIEEGEIKPGIYFESDLSESELLKLDKLSFKYEIIIDDVSEFYIQRNLIAEYKIDRSMSDEYPIPEDWDFGSMGGFCNYADFYKP